MESGNRLRLPASSLPQWRTRRLIEWEAEYQEVYKVKLYASSIKITVRGVGDISAWLASDFLYCTRGRHLAIEHTKPVFRKIHTRATVFRSIAQCLPLVLEDGVAKDVRKHLGRCGSYCR